MTGTVDDGTNQTIPLQQCDIEGTEDYPDVETSASTHVDADKPYVDTSAASTHVGGDKPPYVGHWILWLPLAAPMRALYEDLVAISNRDLAKYYNTSKYISERDRRLAREPFLSMLKRINAYQPWINVINCFRAAARHAAVLPSSLVFATVTSVLLWTPTPLAIKTSYICLSFLFVLIVFGGYLRDLQYLHDPRSRAADSRTVPGPDPFRTVLGRHLRNLKHPRSRASAPHTVPGPDSFRMVFGSYLRELFGRYLRDLKHPRSRAAQSLAFLVAVTSVLLLLGSELSVWAAFGILLLGAAGTLIATLTALLVLKIRSVRIRAAIYLIGVGALLFGATSTRPHQPSWLAQCARSALWASLVLIAVLGLVHLVTYLVVILLWHWKNRRYTIAELVQTLAWVGMSLEEEELPEHERSELARTSPTLSQIGIVRSLEYIANLIEQFLPRQLCTWDRSSDRIIAERCRGMACAVRQIKLTHVLDKSISASEMASLLVPAIGPIVLGDWYRVTCVESQQLPTVPKSRRILRMLGLIVLAVAPLAVVIALRATPSHVPSSTLDQALPITITWLVVSIVTLIDPGTGDRISSTTNLLGAFRGPKPTKG
jgi:hypothetical protein